MYLFNLVIADSLLSICLPFQPDFSLREKAQDHEDLIYSAIVFILSLSQAVSLVFSSGSWQLFCSGIAPSGKSVQWQACWYHCWCGLASGCGVDDWDPAYRPQPKKLIVTQHEVWKWDLQTDVTLCSFSSFLFPSVSYCFALLAPGKLRKDPTTQADNLSCRMPGFWWSLWGGCLALASYLVHIPQCTPTACVHAPQLWQPYSFSS